MTKSCTKCSEIKPFVEFHRNRKSPDGHVTICKPCKNSSWRAAYAADPTKHRANSSRYQRENWAYRKVYAQDWAKRNKDKVNAYTASRWASLRQATPPWLTKEHRKEMRWYYETARDLQWLAEEPLTVDHIEPLRGVSSCGLHVPWNLQIISLSANSRKGNKLER